MDKWVDVEEALPLDRLVVRLWIDTLEGRGNTWCLGYLAHLPSRPDPVWMDAWTDEPFEPGWVVRKWQHLDEEFVPSGPWHSLGNVIH